MTPNPGIYRHSLKKPLKAENLYFKQTELKTQNRKYNQTTFYNKCNFEVKVDVRLE